MSAASLRVRPLLVVGAIVAGLAVAPAVLAESDNPDPSSPPGTALPNLEDPAIPPSDPLGGVIPDRDVLIAMFAAERSLSLDDAELAFDLTGPVNDLIERLQRSRLFGSIWVTYDDGVEINLRVTRPFAARFMERLVERRTGVEVSVSIGGASWRQLHSAADFITENRLPVGYRIDHVDGEIDVYSGMELLGPLEGIVPPTPVEPPNRLIQPQAGNCTTTSLATRKGGCARSPT